MNRDDRGVIHDLAAEEALIGAALLSDTAIETAAYVVDADDFSLAEHKAIWAAILSAYTVGKVDQITVASQLERDGNTGPKYTIAALNAYTVNTPTISNAERYARYVAEHAVRRRLIDASIAVTESAWNNPDAGGTVDLARERFANIDVPAGKPVPDSDFVTFMGDNMTEYDWIIPGVLEHRDRLLITAAEGAGKSMLCAQIGFMTAAGVHCWTKERITPRNVAIIDLENSPRMLSRRLATMRAACVSTNTHVDQQRLRVCARPEGLDLTSRPDRRWLMERCMANNTELLVIGPAYRMSAGVAAKGDIGGEDQARQVTKALDEIRNRCNVTLVMETHAPHGDSYGRNLRPFGSSVWLRWPEFGIGIRKQDDEEGPGSYSVEHWRGPRDQRQWPTTLLRAKPWPWEAILPMRSAA
jgi:hypothetical protein